LHIACFNLIEGRIIFINTTDSLLNKKPLRASSFYNRNRNSKLTISTAPTRAKSREPAYSQALNQKKIDTQGVKTVRRLWWMMFGVPTGR